MQEQMRRKDRQTSEQLAYELLHSGQYGVLSFSGEEPYAVPLSYIVADNFIYFHCATQGKLPTRLAQSSNVCFCVVQNIQPVFDGRFSTCYQSVLVFGKARCVENDSEKAEPLLRLCEKYLPNHIDKADALISSSLAITAVYKISIDHITGKQRALPNQ